jgi:hypothetical protein
MDLFNLLNKKVSICGPYFGSMPIVGRVVDVVGDYLYLDSEPLPFDLSKEGFLGINGYSLDIIEN